MKQPKQLCNYWLLFTFKKRIQEKIWGSGTNLCSDCLLCAVYSVGQYNCIICLGKHLLFSKWIIHHGNVLGEMLAHTLSLDILCFLKK